MSFNTNTDKNSISKKIRINISILCVFVLLVSTPRAFSQISKPIILSLPDDTQVTLPMRWFLADESLVNQMKKQTTGSSSGLLHLLFPSNIISQQKGYPFISIGYSYIGSKEMNNYSFSKFVDVQKKLLSGTLKQQLEVIVPHQFDELALSDLYVDENKQMIIYSSEFGVPNYGLVVGYTAVIKCKKGLLRISLASLKNDLHKYLPAFKILTKTVTSTN